METQSHTITFTLDEGGFEMSVRRKPRNREEFDE
jgi:hypothetical protein